MVIQIFELPLDKKIWTMRVICFFVRFEQGLVVLPAKVEVDTWLA